MGLSECGLLFIANREAFIPYVYDDLDPHWPHPEWRPGMVKRGTLTIGFGTTDEAIVEAFIGKRCTVGQAQEWFLHEIATRFEPFVASLPFRFTQAEEDCVLSFIYNAGEEPMRSGTPRAKLVAGDWDQFPAAIALYNKSKGKVLQGLVERRAAEGLIWSKGDYGFPCPSTPAVVYTEDGDD